MKGNGGRDEEEQGRESTTQKDTEGMEQAGRGRRDGGEEGKPSEMGDVPTGYRCGSTTGSSATGCRKLSSWWSPHPHTAALVSVCDGAADRGGDVDDVESSGCISDGHEHLFLTTGLETQVQEGLVVTLLYSHDSAAHDC